MGETEPNTATPPRPGATAPKKMGDEGKLPATKGFFSPDYDGRVRSMYTSFVRDFCVVRLCTVVKPYAALATGAPLL
jgi:hypothetical protein